MKNVLRIRASPKAKGQTICACCLADFSVDLRNKITEAIIPYVLSGSAN